MPRQLQASQARPIGRVCAQLSGITPAIARRTFATAQEGHGRYDALVVGAGPGGLAATASALDAGLGRVAWVDPEFNSGRVNARYREVPSNTAVKYFCEYVSMSPTLSAIESPAVRMLKAVSNQDDTTQLSNAGDMAKELTEGLKPHVNQIRDHVLALDFDGKWRATLHDGKHVAADRVVLATGSHPREMDLHKHWSHLENLPLDTCLKPSELHVSDRDTIAVIGSSHSAILALMNLYQHKSSPRIINFYRHPLKYAKPMDGWILYDNTGLKGLAAKWARENLEDWEKLPHVHSRIQRICTLGLDEQQVYADYMVGCTKVVYSIGYELNALPRISVHNQPVEPKFNSNTGRFNSAEGQIPALYGIGIAFPEKVTDPYGNVELNVGFRKFMKFAKGAKAWWE